MSASDAFPLPAVPSVSMPQHAVENLRGHAPSLGDSSSWPLDELQLAQFQKAMKARRPILYAARMCRVIYVLLLLQFVRFAANGICALFEDSDASARYGPSPLATAMITGITIAIFYILEWQIRRSQRWAAMVLGGLLLCMFFMLVLGVDAIRHYYLGGQEGQVALGVFIMFAVNIGLIYLAIAAFMAIPEYLKQPTSCQEVIAKGGVRLGPTP
jgi:hypothetical protein